MCFIYHIMLILEPTSRRGYLAKTIWTLIIFIPPGRVFGAIFGRGGRISGRRLRNIKRRHVLPAWVTLVPRILRGERVRCVWPFLCLVRLCQPIQTVISVHYLLSLHILIVRVDKIVVIYFYV